MNVMQERRLVMCLWTVAAAAVAMVTRMLWL